MFSRIQTHELSRSKELLYLIAINDLESIKKQKLVTSTNVNTAIESSSKSPALHYALNHSDGKITQYLLELGADPYILNSNDKNALDISVDLHRKCVYTHVLKKRDGFINDLTDETVHLKKKLKLETNLKESLQSSVDDYRKKISDLEKSNQTLKYSTLDLADETVQLKKKLELETDSKKYLQRSVDDYKTKISNLENSNQTLKLENCILSEEVKSLKSKVSRLDQSINGFLNTNKK